MMSFVILVALLIVFWAVGAYQRLLRQRKQCRTAFSQVDALALHRHELMPALVRVCRERMPQQVDALDALLAADKAILAAYTHAGRHALDAAAIAPLNEAEAALETALGAVLALVPHSDSASSEDISRLIEELGAAESRMAFARQVYNEAARHYNAARAQFPGSVVAAVFAFTPVAALPDAGMRQPDRL